jgi:hypothetical protein
MHGSNDLLLEVDIFVINSLKCKGQFNRFPRGGIICSGNPNVMHLFQCLTLVQFLEFDQARFDRAAEGSSLN